MSVEKPPVVRCPNCKVAMKPGEPKPILFATALVDIPYVCEKCGMQTTRAMGGKVA
jgi:DNA-directed RNA polymerase subunit RPC12/RpoP